MSLRRKMLALVLWGAICARGQDTFENVGRIVAIGDIHGDYERLLELLRSAQVIDRNNVWNGGATHLVLIGDFLDRGPAPRRVMDLLIQLEPQAQAAGGRLHALIGNHEAMNVYGDLRYVSKDDLESYRTPDSAALREKTLQAMLENARAKGSPPKDEAQFRKKFEAEHPLGLVEQRLALAPDGKYGGWLRRQNAIIKINDAIFVHGGISSRYAGKSREEINQHIRGELDDFSKLKNGMAQDEDGPLWYRGLAQLPEDDMSVVADIEQFLRKQQARHIVIGHTVLPAILPRFGGKVITIDVGLSSVYGGLPAFLLIEGPRYYAVYRGQRVDLPVQNGNVQAYLSTVEAIDPQNQKLRGLIRRGAR